MSFVDKFKKILFDDVDDSDELPERTPKGKKDEKHESAGFIDYHHNEEDEENPIREIKVPQEEKNENHVEEQINKFNFPVDTEFDREVPTRSRNYEEMDVDFLKEEREEEIKLVKEVNSFTTEPEFSRKEVRDYRKMLNTESETTHEKKPFTNTPVISPVWGILDKNYKPEEIVDRTETLTKVNTGAMPRSYGPVSYNDQPLVQKKSKTKVQSKKAEELIELNTAISDLINEPIEEEVKKVADTPDVKAERDLDEIIESVETKKNVPTHTIDDIDDEIIQTDNYDDFEEINTSFANNGIETDENDNTNIEDAFESTSEFESIRENDSEESYDEELVDLKSIVNKKEDDNDEDDAGLDNTIETDLFNLIDSMYKDEDE